MRDLKLDDDGLIISETYTRYPNPYLVRGVGFCPSEIALTFDDGPDPVYTREILDVLKDKKVPGTFFVIGKNADANPDIVRREWAEGDEIGNHTFTHPNLAEVSPLRARLELNATQRIIESLTGHGTRLYRPPYGNSPDGHPASDERQAELMRMTQQLGYISVDFFMDPADYEARSSDEIVERLTRMLPGSAAQNDKGSPGNIILLHDGGGNRDNTVKALPRIIDALKRKGYRFVTVSDLYVHGLYGESASSKLGRELLFPDVKGHQGTLAGLDLLIFESSFNFGRLLEVVFVLSIFLGVIRVLVTAPMAIAQARKSRSMNNIDYAPPVTVLVPAYNEAKVICRTVEKLLASDYPDARVIVIDDGSTDGTGDIVEKVFALEPRVTLLRKENAGKSTALNLGLEHAETEIVICVDADTGLAEDAIRMLARHFADPKVGAVAGNVKIGNRKNALTAWQSVEYITSQNFDRRAYGLLNSVPVVPGAIGAWRKSAILEVGGYESSTLAEDTDLTFKVRLAGYHVRTENSALAYTESPDTLPGLTKQRFRWAFGTLQALWKHRRILFKRKYSPFSSFVMPAMWVYSVFFQLLAPVVDIVALIAILSGQLIPVLTYFAALFVVDFAGSFVAFALDKEDEKQLIMALLAAVLLSAVYVLRDTEIADGGHARPVGGVGQAPAKGLRRFCRETVRYRVMESIPQSEDHGMPRLALAILTSPGAAFEEIIRRKLLLGALVITAITGTVACVATLLLYPSLGSGPFRPGQSKSARVGRALPALRCRAAVRGAMEPRRDRLRDHCYDTGLVAGYAVHFAVAVHSRACRGGVSAPQLEGRGHTCQIGLCGPAILRDRGRHGNTTRHESDLVAVGGCVCVG